MTKKTLRTMQTKTGKLIPAGTSVKVAFDVKSKTGSTLRTHVSATAPDGTRIVTRDLSAFGFKIPSVAALERWNDSGACKTVFGATVEPDGVDADGAPSWLLWMGMI